MQTPVRDFYINMLEKRAADEANPEQWSASKDDQQIANAELDANVKDQRAQLKPMFETAAAAEKAETKLVGKLLPKAKANPETASSNPLLKVATHQAFFNGLRQTELLKTASPDYIKAAYEGFEQELDKIAALLAGAQHPGVAAFLKRIGAGAGGAAAKKPIQGKSLVTGRPFQMTAAPGSGVKLANLPENRDPKQTPFRSMAR